MGQPPQPPPLNPNYGSNPPTCNNSLTLSPTPSTSPSKSLRQSHSNLPPSTLTTSSIPITPSPPPLQSLRL